MATQGNNFSQKAAHLRETFFDSHEKGYFIKLLKQPIEKEFHEMLKRESAEKLYKQAKMFITAVELGRYSEEEMPEIEKSIAHLLAAIEDAHPVVSLEKTVDEDYGLGK